MVGVTLNNDILLYLREISAPEWVITQTRDRLRRELEADEREYEELLAAARKREEIQRRKFFARNVKRQVCYLYLHASCATVVNVQQKFSSPEETVSDEDDSFLPDDDEDESRGDVESGVW